MGNGMDPIVPPRTQTSEDTENHPMVPGDVHGPARSEAHEFGISEDQGERLTCYSNENLHLMTSGKRQQLRIDMDNFDGNKRYAQYGNFKVGSEQDKYKLVSVGAYVGNAGDSLNHQVQSVFSTPDKDSSGSEPCAKKHAAGWWFASKGCHKAFLNGRHLDGSNKEQQKGIVWMKSKQDDYSPWFTEMKIRAADKGSEVKPQDCHNCYDIQHKLRKNKNGVYTTYVGKDKSPLKVYCDMTTDGGGWIVFQRRKDGSVDFFRNWNDYKKGFGSVDGEFWLGNDNLHLLTSGRRQELRVELADWDGNKRYAKYDNFKVGSEKEKYKLISLGEYSGNSGDSLMAHKGRIFSTKDQNTRPRCRHLRGGWWYKTFCGTSNLNGVYRKGKDITVTRGDKLGIFWEMWRGKGYSLKFVEMKLRPYNN